jgi:alpha-galactosidase
MEGDFRPSRPLANYPIQKVVKDDFTIIGVHDDFVVSLDAETENIHFLNAQLATEIIIKSSKDFGRYSGIIFDCQGNKVSENEIELSKGATLIEVPPCGMIQLKKVKIS